MARDPRIDAYIEKSAPFAQPILLHLRKLVHDTLPQAEETIKWSMPHFTVYGKNVAGMAAFKAHCAFMIHGEGRQGEGAVASGGMGSCGKITALADLPADKTLASKLEKAAERIVTQGSAAGKRPVRSQKPEIPLPDDFAQALDGNTRAMATLEGFAPSHRREYLEWITGAKREDTRARRIAQAIEWLAEGKKRNWKYESC